MFANINYDIFLSQNIEQVSLLYISLTNRNKIQQFAVLIDFNLTYPFLGHL